MVKLPASLKSSSISDTKSKRAINMCLETLFRDQGFLLVQALGSLAEWMYDTGAGYRGNWRNPQPEPQVRAWSKGQMEQRKTMTMPMATIRRLIVWRSVPDHCSCMVVFPEICLLSFVIINFVVTFIECPDSLLCLWRYTASGSSKVVLGG
jgi:hypothetical protein